MTTINLAVTPHEFTRPLTVPVRAGQTIEQMLRAVLELGGLGGCDIADDVIVEIEGREVPRRLWAHVRPRAGKRVHAYCVGALQGGSVKRIIGAVVMIAVAVFAPQFGAWAAGAFGFGSAAAWSAGFMMLGTLAASALTKPPSPGGGSADGTDGHWYQLTGTSNQANPWGVIPFVIGQHRFFPPYAALPYTETIGEKNYLYCLFDLGHGDIEVSDITIGNTPISSFEEVTYNVTKTPTLYVNDVSEAAVSATIEHGNTVPVVRTTAAGVTSISLDLVYPQGHFGLGTSGKTFSMWTAWRIRYRAVGSGTWLTPSNTRRSGISTIKPAAAPTVSGANFWVESTKKKPFGTSIAWDVAEGQYEVEVTRLGSLRGGSGNQYVDIAGWSVLRSIKQGDPSRTGTNKLELRIRATGQVNGTLQNLSCLVKQKIKVYDSANSQWVTGVTSSNPAWVAWWLLTACPGVGKHVPESKLDFEGFRAFGDFCHGRGLQVNGVCDSAQLLGDLVNDELACALGSLGMRDGRYTVVYDQGDNSPSMKFSPADTRNFQMSRPFVRIPHALRVQFVNPEADWQQDEIIVLDDGYSYRGVDARGNPSSAPEPTLFETLQLRYAADAEQAWKVGRYHFAQAKFRPATYTWESGLAGLKVVRGDCVLVPNDVLEWGDGWGRVISLEAGGISAATITLDNVIETDPAKTYQMKIRKADGSVVSVNLAAAGGETNVFALTSMPSGVQAGDSATLVEVSRQLMPLLVTGIQYDGIDTTTFTAVAYDPRVEPYWDDPPESIVSEITGRDYGAPDPPIVDGVISHPRNDIVNDAGIKEPTVRIGGRERGRYAPPLFEK